jgi:uncharacterized protein involved in outer membrane biogenesis
MKKLLLAGLTGLGLVIVLLLFALPYLTNLDTIRGQVAAIASETLHRPVTLQRLSLRAIPRPGLQIERLRIADRDGLPFATVDTILLEVKPLPLLWREVIVDRVLIQQPVMTLTRHADGSLNLTLPPAGPYAPTLPQTLPPVTVALREARIEDGEVTIQEQVNPGGPPWVRVQGLLVVMDEVSIAPDVPHPGRAPTPFFHLLTGRGILAVREARYRAVTAESLSSNLVLKSGVARLDGISVKVLGGKGNGRVVANLNGKVPEYETALRLDGLQLDRLYDATGHPPGLLSGTASTQEALTARGRTTDEFKRTLTGSIRFEVKDGAVRKMDALGKILSILNVKRLLSGRLPDIAREGLPFDLLSGTLRFKNGLMTTDDLTLDGPAMDVAVQGTFSLPDNQVRMRASALGMDFDVQGPSDDLTVSPRAGKGVSEGVGSLLEKGLGLFR